MTQVPTGWYVVKVQTIHEKPDAKSKLLDAALSLIRTKGYCATTVDEVSCLVRTMVQEIYETMPPIREACRRCITTHAGTLEADIDAAICARKLSPKWTAKSLALHTQTVVQGAFILAKAQADPR